MTLLFKKFEFFEFFELFPQLRQFNELCIQFELSHNFNCRTEFCELCDNLLNCLNILNCATIYLLAGDCMNFLNCATTPLIV